MRRNSSSIRELGFRRSAERRGSTALLGTAAVVAFIAAAGGGIWWWAQNREGSDDASILLHTVARGDFELTITERGEIEAADVTEVRSLVKSPSGGGTAILRIVPEGTEVEAGDFLVELDSSALEAERTTQRIALNASKAAEVEARNLFETAQIAKREYIEGTYVQERQVIESEVFVAEENLNRAREYFAYSQKLASRGYVNELQLEADRFAVEKARKDLEAAKTKLHVLDEFAKPKMLSQLESDILISEAKWESSQNSFELESDKLSEIEDQIAKCTITAPQPGVVKYAHDSDRRGDQQFIVEEGTIIRERQAIVRIPNANVMQVTLTINESLIQYVRPGMLASINPVGMGDLVLRGTVTRINQYAEPSGWRRANVKEYKAFVTVDETAPGLRAGLTASVTIQSSRVYDTLQVPVQAIYVHGDKFYCFVYSRGLWEAREIKPGPTNDKFFVVEEGLNEGERVALNPRRYARYVDLPRLSPEEMQRAVPVGATGDFDEEGASTAPDGAMGPPDGRPFGAPGAFPGAGTSDPAAEGDGADRGGRPAPGTAPSAEGGE